jgi:hypothetical protein
MCCRCLGKNCILVLQICVIVTAILLLGLGAVGIWLGYEVHEAEIVQSFYLEDVGYGIIAFGAFLIFSGLLGMIVGFFKWRVCVIFYFFLQLVLAVVLIFCAGALIYGRNFVDDNMQNRTQCRDYDELKTADDYVILAA